jgi:RNA polymerase sigma factor (sigma-70 family)
MSPEVKTAGERHVAGRRLPDTSWTLLVAARGRDVAGAAARNEFARRYWRPVHAYIGAIVRDLDRADDLTQEFFEKKMDRVVEQAEPTMGNFRPFLKRAVHNFVTDARRAEGRAKKLPKTRAKKANEGAALPDSDDDEARRIKEVRPDAALDGQGWAHIAGPAQLSPDAAFHIGYVRALFEDVIEEVRAICEQKDQHVHFDLFVEAHLRRSGNRPKWRELGALFDLDEKAARNRVDIVLSRFREVLRTRLAADIGSSEGADEEIAALLEGL